MASVPPRFVKVDMQDLKVPLLACALADRVSVSSLVREAVVQLLGLTDRAAGTLPIDPAAVKQMPTVKLSIRVLPSEAEQFASGARAARLSRGAYFAALLAGSVIARGDFRVEQLAALPCAFTGRIP